LTKHRPDKYTNTQQKKLKDNAEGDVFTIHTDRQTDRQTDGQTHRQTDSYRSMNVIYSQTAAIPPQRHANSRRYLMYFHQTMAEQTI